MIKNTGLRERQTQKKPTQVHRAEATIKFLVILLQYIQIFYKIHKSIKAKEVEVFCKSIHLCVLI